MNRPGFRVRRMTADEVGLVRDWSLAENWNPGTHDGPAFFAADPAGFFVGLLGEVPVACVSCVRYGDGYGFLGQYIVRPPHRGGGYGPVIGRAGLAHLAGRPVGLDGVLGKVRAYERAGFRVAHHTTRYTGTGGGTRPAGLESLADVPFEVVAAYDAVCFPAPREGFLRRWVSLPESVALGAATGGRLTGYGVLRRAAFGYKVGPLFADDVDTAARLLAGLAAAIPGQPYGIDVPDETAQPAGARLVRQFGLSETFRTARMYAGRPPAFDTARVFGVTTLELG